MSAEAEIARQHIEAFGRGDGQASMSFVDEHVVWDASRSTVEGSVTHGRAEMERQVVRYLGAFVDYTYELRELVDLGGGTVIATVRERGRGKASQLAVDRYYAVLYHVIDGRIVRATLFASKDDAVAAIGGRGESA